MTFSNVKELWVGNNEPNEDYYILYRNRICKITGVRFVPGGAMMYSIRIDNLGRGMCMLPLLVHGDVEVLVKLNR